MRRGNHTEEGFGGKLPVPPSINSILIRFDTSPACGEELHWLPLAQASNYGHGIISFVSSPMTAGETLASIVRLAVTPVPNSET